VPWRLQAHYRGCGAGKPWAVIKQSDGKLVACHASKAEAVRQLRALYASEYGTGRLMVLDQRDGAVFYSEDQPRDAHGRFGEGGTVSAKDPDAPQSHGGGSAPQFTQAERDDALVAWSARADLVARASVPFLKGEILGADEDRDSVRGVAAAITEEFAVNGSTAPELYRGMTLDFENGGAGYTAAEHQELFDKLTDHGGTLDLALSSFSESVVVANDFQVRSAPDGMANVLVTLERGARGVDVGDRSLHDRSEREWITAGRFQVTQVEHLGDNEHRVTIRRLG
jgi:hypothetical protein